MPDTPDVLVNGRNTPWTPGLSVADLVAADGRPADLVATALNGTFVARARRRETLLQPGDHLMLFEAITGG